MRHADSHDKPAVEGRVELASKALSGFDCPACGVHAPFKASFQQIAPGIYAVGVSGCCEEGNSIANRLTKDIRLE